MTTEIFSNICKILSQQQAIKKVTTIKKEESINFLIAAIERVSGYDKEEISGSSRVEPVLFARYVFAHIANEDIKLHPTQIAQILNRDRTTVLNSLEQANRLMMYNSEFKSLYDNAKSIFTKYLDRKIKFCTAAHIAPLALSFCSYL